MGNLEHVATLATLEIVRESYNLDVKYFHEFNSFKIFNMLKISQVFLYNPFFMFEALTQFEHLQSVLGTF